MRPSLQLRIGQQLTMTPQLQQAIKLLQLSTLDLQQEIQEALESNPLLEVEEGSTSQNENQPDNLEEAFSASASDSTTTQTTDGSEDAAPTSDEISTTEAMDKSDIPEELNIDTTWDDTFSAGVSGASAGPASDDYVYQGETTDSIQDHLIWQMDLTPFSDTDRAIATAIIDAVDDAGYLTVTTEDILESLGDEEIELDEVEAVLRRVQQFDPAGVAARDLSECLQVTAPVVRSRRLRLRRHVHLHQRQNVSYP